MTQPTEWHGEVSSYIATYSNEQQIGEKNNNLYVTAKSIYLDKSDSEMSLVIPTDTNSEVYTHYLLINVQTITMVV